MHDVIDQRPPRRRWIAFVIIAALVAVPLLVLLLNRGGGTVPSAAPSPTATARPAPTAPSNVIYPKATGAAIKNLKVTFPDGTRAEVRYPAELALAELGVRPYATGTVGTYYRKLVAPLYGESDIAADGTPVRTFNDHVTLWSGGGYGGGSSGARGQIMLFTFGRWRIALHDEPDDMPFEQRMLWAGSLRGRVTDDGFLVLTAKEPVRLSLAGEVLAGQPTGPELWFGGDQVDTPMVALVPALNCSDPRMPLELSERPVYNGMTCRDGVTVAASGDRDFVARAVTEIHVRLLR